MQSRPFEVSISTSTNLQPQELQNRQHGVDHHDEPSPHPFSSGERGEPSGGSASKANRDTNSATQPDEAAQTPSRRLSGENLPRDRSPVDRISEYEQASSPSPRSLPRGLGFKVIARSKKPGTETLGLADFPNGNLRSSHPSTDVHTLI